MPADGSALDALRGPRTAGLSSLTARAPKPVEEEHADGGEGSCPAFGFLRGLHARAEMVEFRFKGGDTLAFPYSWLGPVRFNPSVGLLLKFTGDVVTLVLIRGSNLDAPVNAGAVTLTGDIQRHRIKFVREMDGAENRLIGEGGPTVDAIEVAEFESQAALTAWLKQHAPAFLR